MNTSLLARSTAIVPRTPAADYSSSDGHLVDLSSGTATISTSATTPAKGIILEGNRSSAGYASETVSIGILGALTGTVRMRASGTIAKDALVQQSSNGTVITDAESGARVIVGVAMEDGISGENIEVAPIAPRIIPS
ncbi:MAG TPA: hypothetical protein P5186_19915 [Candidatus Paceibacterota bacterium]|nr:hypothetical protein [Verrucomicrobiota bacterium]HRY50326.1 hypothetical protein [Candidatus Paceibacterota bacterium]